MITAVAGGCNLVSVARPSGRAASINCTLIQRLPSLTVGLLTRRTHLQIEVDLVHILAALFGKVIVPPAVLTELQHPKTPLKVKAWIFNPPTWLEVRQANLATFTPQKKIGPGEREAFALALEIKVMGVLLDDRAAMVEYYK